MNKKYILLQIFGFLFCVGVPIAATLIEFPLIINRSPEAQVGSIVTVGGCTIFGLMMSGVPILKKVGKWLKGNASAWMAWWIGFVVLIAINQIVHEMTIVFLWGAIGNSVGAIFFQCSRKEVKKDE